MADGERAQKLVCISLKSIWAQTANDETLVLSLQTSHSIRELEEIVHKETGSSHLRAAGEPFPSSLRRQGPNYPCPVDWGREEI